MSSSIPAPIVNLQVSPGFIAFPPSTHPGIGACDPLLWGLLTPGSVPGHPTAVQPWCEGTSEPGKYPSMLWAPESLLEIPPTYSKCNLDCDVTLSTSMMKCQCLEIDVMHAVNGLVFPFGFHLELQNGGNAQVCDPTGAKWLDAGFSVELVPNLVQHFTLQMGLDFAGKTLTWLGIVIAGKPFRVQNPDVAAAVWPSWGKANGMKPQFQLDNPPAAPLISPVIDNCNLWFG